MRWVEFWYAIAFVVLLAFFFRYETDGKEGQATAEDLLSAIDKERDANPAMSEAALVVATIVKNKEFIKLLWRMHAEYKRRERRKARATRK